MVYLHRLIANNFKHLDVDITFPNGILAISGPNESGKSSIIEALLYAFFGRTHKAPRGEKERLINYDAESMVVQLEFEVEGKIFRITRKTHKKRPSEATLHEIQPDGSTHRHAINVTNVNAAISELIGDIDLSDVLASNVVLQKDLDRLTKLQKMERRHVINAMMGRECFTRAVDRLANDIRPLRNERLPQIKEVLLQLQQQKDRYQENKQELETKQKTRKRIETELKTISQTYAQTEKRYTAIKAYKEIKDEQDRLKREYEHKQELKSQQEKEISRLGKLRKRKAQLLAQKKRFLTLDDDLAVFDELRTAADSLESSLHEQSARTATISRLELQIGELEPSEDVEAEYEQVQAQRIAAEASQQKVMSPLLYIPSIGFFAASVGAILFNTLVGLILLACSIPFILYLIRTYLTYHRAKPKLEELRHREQELSEIRIQQQSQTFLSNQLQEESTHRDALGAQISKLSDTISSLLPSLSADLTSSQPLPPDPSHLDFINHLKGIEQKLQEDNAQRGTLEDELQLIETQLTDLSQLEQDLQHLAKDISSISKLIAKIELPALPADVPKYSETIFEELDKKVRDLAENKASLQTERKTTRERIDELTALLERDQDLVEKFEKKQEEVTQLEETIAVGQLTIEMLRDVAERGREQVRPRVVNVMGRLLAAITNGKYRFPKLSEDYSLKVYSSIAGEFINADLFSGGTEDQFLLALRLGFAIALLPHGRGTAPQFLLLDEPFAGSDTDRRDNIIQLLHDELSKAFQQIIVVSHQPVILRASEHQIRMINGRVISSE
jgi:exonuclease SbcC